MMFVTAPTSWNTIGKIMLPVAWSVFSIIDFNKYAERKDTDNTHVINAQLRKLRLRSKSLDKGTRAEYTNQAKSPS